MCFGGGWESSRLVVERKSNDESLFIVYLDLLCMYSEQLDEYLHSSCNCNKTIIVQLLNIKFTSIKYELRAIHAHCDKSAGCSFVRILSRG